MEIGKFLWLMVQRTEKPVILSAAKNPSPCEEVYLLRRATE